MKRARVIVFQFVLNRFSFVSNVTNFFIYSLNRFVLKKTTHKLLGFFNRMPYMQIYPLNASKLDWKENLIDFCVESTAVIIKDSYLYNSNMGIGKYLDRQLSSKNVQSKVWFMHAIHHTFKCFCTCDRAPLLEGPVTWTKVF